MTGFLNGGDDQISTGGFLADPAPAPAPAPAKPAAPKPAAPQPDPAAPPAAPKGPTWADVTRGAKYQALPQDQKDAARSAYFDTYVAGQVPSDQVDAAKSLFLTQSKAADYQPPSLLDRIGSAASDLASGAAEKVEAAAYGLGGGFAKLGKTVALLGAVPSVIRDKIAGDDTASSAVFANAVAPFDRAIDYYSQHGDALPQTTGNKIAAGVGDLAASMPAIIAAGGGINPATKYMVDVAKYAFAQGMTREAVMTLVKGGADTLGSAIVSMSPASIPSATEKYQKLVSSGVDNATAAKAAFADLATTSAMGAVPMGMAGGIPTRVASGAVAGAAMAAGGTAVQNQILSAYPDQQQDPLAADNLIVGGVTGGALHGLMGHGKESPVTVTRTGQAGIPQTEPAFNGTTIDEATGRPVGEPAPAPAAAPLPPDAHSAGLTPEQRAADDHARAAFADLDPTASPEAVKAAEQAQAPQADPVATDGHDQLAAYLQRAQDGFMEAYQEGDKQKFADVRANLVENLTSLLGADKADDYATHLVDEGGIRNAAGVGHPYFDQAARALDAQQAGQPAATPAQTPAPQSPIDAETRMNAGSQPADKAPAADAPKENPSAPAAPTKPVVLSGEDKQARIDAILANAKANPNGGRLTPFSHPDLSDVEVRAELAHMADEAGWAQVGGRMMREDATDQSSPVTGRTPWIAKHPWYGAMTERLNEGDTVEAVGKALTGAPMTAKEKRVVANMLHFAKGSLAERDAWYKQAQDEVGATSPEEYRAIQAHADHIEGLDADIPFATDDPRLKTLNTDKEINEAFGIHPEGSGLSEKPAARDAAKSDEGAGAAPGAGPEAGFQLAGETPAEVKSKQKQTEKTKAAERKAKAEQDAKEKAGQTAKDIKQRAGAAADDFKLGENAEDALSGQRDLLAEPAPKPKTEKEAKARKAADNFKANPLTADGVHASELKVGQDVTLHRPQGDVQRKITEINDDPKLGHLVRLADENGFDQVHLPDQISTKAASATDDLSSMFDDIMAETAPAKPKTEKQAKAAKAAKSRAAGEAAVSAAKNTAGGLADAIDGLGKLFGADSGAMGSGPVFNEDTYAKAKPFFQAAVEHFKGALADIKDVMRAVIKQVSDKFGRDTAAKMKDYIVRFMQDYREGKTDAIATGDSIEQDRGVDHAAQQGREGALPDGSGAAERADRGTGPAAGAKRDRPAADNVVHQPGADAGRARRGDKVLEPAGELRSGSDDPESGDAEGGSADSAEGSAADDAGPNAAIADHDAARDVKQSQTFAEKVVAQKAAGSIPVKIGDRANIDATLPLLQDGQREDVHFAEKRLAKPDGHGVLFTNGTGTGKTFLSLGIVKRMIGMGKKNGTVLVPSSEVMREWLMSAPHLGIDLHQLKDKQDAGKGVSITTYANFGDNKTLLDRPHDFVVADEAHSLMSGKDSEPTRALATLRAITLHPDSAVQRTEMIHRDLLAKMEPLREESRALSAKAGPIPTPEDGVAMKKIADKLRPLEQQYQEHLNDQRELLASTKSENRPRLIATTATPFAWEPNVQWAEGYLFSYPKVKQTGAYNEPNGYQRYMMQHFGYRMRVGKLTTPEATVNRDLMQIQYNKHLRDTGVLSTRMLDVEKDYDRKFHLIDGGIGAKIDQALDWLRNGEDGKYSAFHKKASEQFDYLTQSRLLEAIKANASIDIIKQHHALGRKVLIFHDYNQGGGFAPFDFKGDRGDVIKGTVRKGLESQQVEYTRGEFMDAFASKFPELVGDDLAKLKSPIEALKEAFPNAHFNNGTVSKKKALEGIRAFNDDSNPDANLLVVQSAKNAGWSGHDTTGKFMRVSINLGLPTSPTKPIQLEGRIYRTGQMSDAAQRYLNTGTMFERIAFANSISSRSSTVENLAMGDFARGLKKSFIEAFQNSDTYTPGPDDGKGGKAMDRRDNSMTDFDRAKSYYFAQEKKTARNKAAEGKDYFATPEPLGYKMVQWLDPKPGNELLEPSAGHGAIARWFPDDTTNKAIEPSTELASRLALVTDPKGVINDDFESHHIANKYDGIAMNPPFGTSGKLAMDHVAKAFGHLRESGRIVAIVPDGPAMGKRLNDWLTATLPNGKLANPDAKLEHVIDLPASTFSRAGTGVKTRVVIIDRVKGGNDGSGSADSTMPLSVDGRDGDINDLFDHIEHMSVPPRPAAPAEAEARSGVTNYAHGRVVDDARDAVFHKVGDKLETDAPVVRITTGKGNELDGVIVQSRSLAVSIDPRTWKPKGQDGFFVRMKHVIRPQGDSPAAFSLDSGAGHDDNVSSAPLTQWDADKAIGTALSHLESGVQGVEFASVQSFGDLPTEILKQAERDGVSGGVKGVFHDGKVYLVLDANKSPEDLQNTVFHELYGHAGLQKLFGKNVTTQLDQLYRNIGGLDGLQAIAEAHGIDLNRYIESVYNNDKMDIDMRRRLMMEELLSHIAEKGPSFKRSVRAVIGSVRSRLRGLGFGFITRKLGTYDINELENILKHAKDALGQQSDAPTNTVHFALAPKKSAWNGADLSGRESLSPIEKIRSMRDGYSPYVGVEAEKMPSTPFGDSLKKVFAPATRGDAATETASIIRANLGKQAREREVAMARLEKTAAMFDKLPVSDSYRFIDNMERGTPNGIPQLDDAAKALRTLLDERRDAVIALGKGQLENFNENYFPHIWKQKRTAASFFSRSSMEGSKDFLKQRSHEYFSDGLHAGLDPVTTNPVELTMLKAREMDRYIYGQRIFGEMKQAGIAKFVKFGTKAPDGFAKLNDKIARVMNYSDAEKAMILRGDYYAPEKAATVFNNHLSPGLAGIGFYDMWRAAGAAMNAAQLGLSAFHLGFTSMDVMVSKVALGVKQISRGDFLKGVGNVAMGVSPAQPIMNIIKGDRLLRAYLDKLQDPELAPIVDALMQAGGRVKMDDFFRAAPVNAFKQALRQGKYGSAAMKALPRALDLLNKPIFEHLVPRQKLGVFFDMAKDLLAKYPNMTLQEKRERLGKLWDSVDNRMGELVYDNVFWNKTLKDALMATTRSVGWNLGTFREIGGGVKDLKDAISEKSLSDRSAYLFALPFVAAVMGAIIQYLYTGESPRDMKDSFFPRTGKMRPDGSEDRLSLPSYIKDIYEYGHDISGWAKFGSNPLQTVRNKVHPLIGTVGEMLDNKDFFGNNIRSPGDSAVQQAQDEAGYLLKQMEPFSVRNFQQQNQAAGKTGSPLDYVASPQFIGLGNAPGYITKTDKQIESGEVYRQMPGLEGKFRQELKDHPEGNKMAVVKRMRAAGMTDGQIRHVLTSAATKHHVARQKSFGLGLASAK